MSLMNQGWTRDPGKDWVWKQGTVACDVEDIKQ